jgi:hypothetical protein
MPRGVGLSRGLGPNIPHSRGVVPAFGLGLENSDFYQQTPKLGRAIDLKLTTNMATKKRPENGLHHVFAIDPAGRFPA